MRKFALLFLLLASPLANAAIGDIYCDHCTTNTQFGYFGASYLLITYGPYAPSLGALGYDRINVRNRFTGKKVFVDMNLTYEFPGVDFTIATFTTTEVGGGPTDTTVIPIEELHGERESLEEYGRTPTLDEAETLPSAQASPITYNSGRTVMSNGVWTWQVSSPNTVTVRITVVECSSYYCPPQ